MRPGQAVMLATVEHEVLVGVVQHQPGARRRAQLAGPLHLLPAEEDPCRTASRNMAHANATDVMTSRLWRRLIGHKPLISVESQSTLETWQTFMHAV